MALRARKKVAHINHQNHNAQIESKGTSTISLSISLSPTLPSACPPSLWECRYTCVPRECQWTCGLAYGLEHSFGQFTKPRFGSLSLSLYLSPSFSLFLWLLKSIAIKAFLQLMRLFLFITFLAFFHWSSIVGSLALTISLHCTLGI